MYRIQVDFIKHGRSKKPTMFAEVVSAKDIESAKKQIVSKYKNITILKTFNLGKI